MNAAKNPNILVASSGYSIVMISDTELAVIAPDGEQTELPVDLLRQLCHDAQYGHVDFVFDPKQEIVY